MPECKRHKSTDQEQLDRIISEARDFHSADIIAIAVYEATAGKGKSEEPDLELVVITSKGTEDNINEHLLTAIRNHHWHRFISLTVASEAQFRELADLGDAFAIAVALKGICVHGADYFRAIQEEILSKHKAGSNRTLSKFLNSRLDWRTEELFKLSHVMAEHVYWLYAEAAQRNFIEESGHHLDYERLAGLASPQQVPASINPRAGKMLKKVLRLRRQVHAHPDDVEAFSSLIRLWGDFSKYNSLLHAES